MGVQIGALISGGGSNLQAILDACTNGALHAEVVFVGSDNPDAAGLQRAKDRGVATFVVDYRRILASVRAEPQRVAPPDDFVLQDILQRQHLLPADTDPARLRRFLTSRAVAEKALLDAMAPFRFDLLVLAGFMRTLSPYFIDRVSPDPLSPRIMNIHPALLPAFPGVDGYGDTWRYGCKVAGCTVHFVDYGEDSGPIIGQASFPIEAEDTLESVRRKGLEREWVLYPACIRLFAEKRLKVEEETFTGAHGQVVKRKRVRILPERG